MISVSTDSLLSGIGCNMTEEGPSGMLPEDCLAELSKRALSDPKIVALMIGALVAHKDLFHPEMLLKCLHEKSVDSNVLGALLSKTRDRRFKKTIAHCRRLRRESSPPSRILLLAVEIGQAPVDAEFESFGLKITELTPADGRKIMSQDRLVRKNLFFRNRLLFGCNWRADIVSCLQSGFTNPTQVKKRLQCSYETAHRVFSDYMALQRATPGHRVPGQVARR